ncbi:MAG: LURP-one-related/scramblase family protein [Promethearchaeota archaeon]
MTIIPYCKSCGVLHEELPNFCSECGTDLRQQLVSDSSTVTPVPEGIGSLFDPLHEFYVLKERYWDWGSGPIMDYHGNVLGHMNRRFLSLRRLIEFKELDGSMSAVINAKIIAVRPTYELKAITPNGAEVPIGRIQKTLLSFFRPHLWMEDEFGQRIFDAQGNFMGFQFEIIDSKTGQLAAHVDKLDKWRDIFLGGLFDYSDTYAVQIFSPTYDRRQVLGLILAIDNILHDQNN